MILFEADKLGADCLLLAKICSASTFWRVCAFCKERADRLADKYSFVFTIAADVQGRWEDRFKRING